MITIFYGIIKAKKSDHDIVTAKIQVSESSTRSCSGNCIN